MEKQVKTLAIKFSITSVLFLFLAAPAPSQARRVTVQGKCAFLLEQAYDEKCSITMKDEYISLLPKASGLTKIYGQQISDFNLADKSTMRMNESLALYESALPWWSFRGVPKWVKEASKTKVEKHEIVLGYVDPRKANPASLVLIVLDDKSKAAALVSQLSKITGLRAGEKVIPGSQLSPTLKMNLLKNARRQAQRVAGLCMQRMFNDAEPPLEKLDNFIYNSTQNISMFNNSEATVNKLEDLAFNARQSCESEYKRELAELEAAERARLEEIRRREAKRRQAAILARAKAAEAAAAARRKAFEDLTSY